MDGGVAKFERLTVTVMDDLDVFASASVTLPLVGITAVASMLECWNSRSAPLTRAA